MKTDVQASWSRDAFLEALAARSGSRRLQSGSTLYTGFDVILAYELKEDQAADLLHETTLRRLRALESEMKSLPGWVSRCSQTEPKFRSLCETGISFVSHAYPQISVPTGQVVPTTLDFNGTGSAQIPLGIATRMVEARELDKIIFPEGFHHSLEGLRYLRSAFRFEFRCCNSMDSNAYQREMVDAWKADWKEFLVELLPYLQGLSLNQELPFKVYYEGSDIDSVEVMQALLKDISFAGGSVVFVLLYVMLHTRSFLIGVAGLLAVILTIPLSYVLSAMLTGGRTITIASFVSLFLVVGLGSDVIFVYSDFWKNSAKIEELQSLQERLVWTYVHAGKASLATTSTTAVSFFANLASVLKPLREFGFFMGLCVMLAWAILSLVVVPLCVVEETHMSAFCLGRCHERCHKKKDAPEGSGALVEWWTWGVFRWRRSCAVAWFLLIITFLACTFPNVRVNSGVPNVFPAEHNQNRGKEVLQEFDSLAKNFKRLYELPDTGADVCDLEYFGGQPPCPMYWCEATKSLADEGQCQCFGTSEGRQNRSRATLRLVHDESLDARSVANLAAEALASQDGSDWHGDPLLEQRSPVLLQEWETGATELKSSTDFSVALSRASPAVQLCFCGSLSCKPGSSWQEVPALVPTSLQGPSENETVLAQEPAGRLLASWQVAPHSRAWVDVAFGVEPTARSTLLGDVESEDLWRFHPEHDVRQPWAQRLLLSFCTQLPEKLRVTDRQCWIEEFREHLLSQGGRFPATPNEFDAEIGYFSTQRLVKSSPSSRFLWMRGGEVKASYVRFQIDVHRYAPSSEALVYQKYWDEYMEEWQSQNSGVRFLGRAFHSAQLWVRAEAQAELIASTVVTVVTALLLSFLGMLLCTRDLSLALLVTVTSAGCVAGLAFFMVVVMGWEIGAVEVIALIIFIGYAVTYSLHVAHGYGAAYMAEEVNPAVDPLGQFSEEADEAMSYLLASLKALGSAALGSAATTAGCATFLIFCTLTIFQRLGSVVMVVTAFSIVSALLPLPAALLWFGPRRPGRFGKVLFHFFCKGELPASKGPGGDKTAHQAYVVPARDVKLSSRVDPEEVAIANSPKSSRGKAREASPERRVRSPTGIAKMCISDTASTTSPDGSNYRALMVLAASPVAGSGVAALDAKKRPRGVDL